MRVIYRKGIRNKFGQEKFYATCPYCGFRNALIYWDGVLWDKRECEHLVEIISTKFGGFKFRFIDS